MGKFYTDEKNAQIIIALLKEHGIKKVIASPGTTNMALVVSMQFDPFFEVYSSVDERSAAYMACGLVAESGEPVVISCTGATASRNYLPGLTEAYYRKLPVLTITSTQPISSIGHNIAQVIDRSSLPTDIANLSLTLPIVENEQEKWDCEIKVNKAILELKRNGGGPVHINLPTTYGTFETKELPIAHKIERYELIDKMPRLLENDLIAIFIGAHVKMSNELTLSIEKFCEKNNAVVFCDHTSGYYGNYRILGSILGGQSMGLSNFKRPDLVIHIGEVTGDYYSSPLIRNKVWRVSPDGEIKDTFKKLIKVFQMDEASFFNYYAINGLNMSKNTYFPLCTNKIEELRSKLPEIPFSNIWIASMMAHLIPQKSTIHFAILNSLRSWNFFELPKSVESSSNVGGFGIDGCMSTLIGASLTNKEKLYFSVIGDLAFFYDMNVLGNRHVGNNLRILMINNGVGTEFRQYNHRASEFGNSADAFVAASGHYGQKSPKLVKNYAENLGFEYLTASNKKEFTDVYKRFLESDITEKSMFFEVFTENEKESYALERMLNIEENVKGKAVKVATQLIGKKGIKGLKGIIGK
ncbi:thiamine pyrophosphate-binding protein [Wenyingzhuangia sp. chi5]|uniref:Thiamine pyrophosphate-binding protein n=1 Tax=Wenyingzhuangia gilva TaxID=3057677 RepID=A0ABT8VNU3_9FLAO|nr:thiamine pyrophosphate-binding protein [Wenyingzhuangia sp. chi5]MDO3693635.1 thiamine pyrophosphate-binding protein [Wenyingzhuangia sp. chi5]